jgi:UDP-N-acetylmuramoylalanine--D-glutamate ligase
MGLGRFGGGAAAVKWLVEQGDQVTLTDHLPIDQLEKGLDLLAPDRPGQLSEEELIDYLCATVPLEAAAFGRHQESDFRDAELIVVNPAVRPDNRFLKIASQAGIATTTEIGLFLDACPAHVIGVTGSNGKSTTAAMVAHLLRCGGKKVWLGGNSGGSLLGEICNMTSDDWTVLELSSFQLARLAPGTRLPEIGVVTNFSPNHLDWHRDLDDYRRAKLRIFSNRAKMDTVLLGPKLIGNGTKTGWNPRIDGPIEPLYELGPTLQLKVPGRHNRENGQIAATVARAVGIDEQSILDGLSSFVGLPGRLELIGTIASKSYINDTTSTTPESTVVALESLAEQGRPVWLLAGGATKGCESESLVQATVNRASGAAFFGQVGRQLAEKVVEQKGHPPVNAFKTLDEAFDWCQKSSEPDAQIVLSPGFSSHDQYTNFVARGEHFQQLVDQLRTDF